MANTTEKLRHLDPTVIPAQPGYRIALLGYGDRDEVTAETKPADLWVFYKPIIAWTVQPLLREQFGDSEVRAIGVHAVTLDGLMESDDAYIVAPDGSWSQPYVQNYDSEDQARQLFIESKLKGR